MNVEEEYIESKLQYECMGMQNTPVDPIERAKASIQYKKAQARYFKANQQLIKSLSMQEDAQ